jgi:PIN domain nuclease of toxin-antitoxin system
MNQSLLITDTPPLIWYTTNKLHKLPKKVVKAFDNAIDGHNTILIPMVALWEISLAIKAGKLREIRSLEEHINSKFFANSISILPIEVEDIMHSHQLQFTHDPFDTMIVAMAKRMEAPLITGDSIIHKHKPCALYWD